MTSGQYNIEFWETFSGTIIDNKKIEVKGNSANIEIIPFTRDIAVKLKYNDKIQEGCGCSALSTPSPLSAVHNIFIISMIILVVKLTLKLKKRPSQGNTP